MSERNHWMREQSLKNRDLAHRMNDRGTPVDFIARYLAADIDSVRRWLAMAKPEPLPRPDADDSWMVQGTCRSVDPDMWFPDRGNGTSHKAKAICRDCPVQRRCLEWALAHNETFGIWGGEDADTRFRMRVNALERERQARKRGAA